MHIDSYRFGEMLVNGRSYSSDLIIFGDRIEDQWWRENGHLVRAEDLVEVSRRGRTCWWWAGASWGR